MCCESRFCESRFCVEVLWIKVLSVNVLWFNVFTSMLGIKYLWVKVPKPFCEFCESRFWLSRFYFFKVWWVKVLVIKVLMFKGFLNQGFGCHDIAYFKSRFCASSLCIQNRRCVNRLSTVQCTYSYSTCVLGEKWGGGKAVKMTGLI